MKRFLLVGLLVSCLASCATVGKEISEQKVSQIKKGVTTEQTLVNEFGKPYAETVDSDGNKSLVWTYAHATAFSAGQGKSLSVKLDKNGVVENYALSSVNQ